MRRGGSEHNTASSPPVELLLLLWFTFLRKYTRQAIYRIVTMATKTER